MPGADQRLEGFRSAPGGVALLVVGAAAVAGLGLIALFSQAVRPLALSLAAGVAGLVLILAIRPAKATDLAAANGPAARETGAAPIADILENLDDPVLVVSGVDATDLTDRRFLFVNAAAGELFRIQRPEGPLATAIRAPEVLEAVDEALFGAIPAAADYAPGGAQDRVWRARVSPLPGEARRALLILHDETEVRRAERTRADFLANASHELRTPLASLNGFIETLRGHARDDPEARDRFLAIMHRQAQRMSRLIEDLMSLSRIELNEHVPPAGVVDLSLVVADAMDGLAPLAQERCVAFRIAQPAAGAGLVVGDRDQLLQVVQNLAENALKYSPKGSSVGVEVVPGLGVVEAASPREPHTATLSLVTPDHAVGQAYVALRVQDAGPGLAREHLPRLTERFYRVEGQKSGERSGTGLGLAIVKHIVNRHRGGLFVESAEGEGAAFTACFPAPSDPARS
jgi:two-component system phosphate regulon sensor histidine kinase PhoR